MLQHEMERLFLKVEKDKSRQERADRLIPVVRDAYASVMADYASDAAVMGWKLTAGEQLNFFLLSFNDFFCSSKNVGAVAKTVPHTHEYLELLYVVKGTIKQIINGKEITFMEGEFGLIDTHCEHQEKLEGDSLALFFIIPDRLFHTVLNDKSEDNLLNEFLSSALLSQATSRQNLRLIPKEGKKHQVEPLMETFLQELEQHLPGASYVTFGLVYRLLNVLYTDYEFSLTREQFKEKTRIIGDTIIRYVDQHYADITIAELMDEFHYNADYFNRLFKNRFQMTYSEYVQQVRLQNAEMALTKTTLPIRVIAEQCGYSNKTHFYKLFKQRYGCTPTVYRNRKTS